MTTRQIAQDRFGFAQAFVIARGARDAADVVTVTLRDGDARGRGECVPYARYGEDPASVTAQIEAVPPSLPRVALAERLAPGAARNALDCAAWDLEAKRSGRPVWDVAGLAEPRPVTTAYTLSLDAPERMQAAAAAHADRPILKIKLGADGDMARLEAVRRGAPDARIIVDANEAWSAAAYADLAPHLRRLGVAMVEQPLPAGDDDALGDLARPVPVCADEACHDRASLAGLRGKYDMVNIKLDKTGGLTEALALRRDARAAGFGVMVGCMMGSSLAMAPALLVAQGADLVDLDAPLLLAEDREPALRYEGSAVSPPPAALWG